MLTMTSPKLANKELISEELWARVSGKIEKSDLVKRYKETYGEFPDLADRMLDQSLSFLLLCGSKEKKENPFSPAPYVDEAWHNFILHLRPYLDFCNEKFGRVIYHNPYNDGKDYAAEEPFADRYARAIVGMNKRGLYVDYRIWNLPIVGCNPDSGDCCEACCGDDDD